MAAHAVWKFAIPLTSERTLLEIPHEAEFVHAEMRPSEIWVWAVVNPDAPKERIGFFVVGTGHLIPADSYWCGTVLDGQFVWHVFRSASMAPLKHRFRSEDEED
jgi:hypothetical protein